MPTNPTFAASLALALAEIRRVTHAESPRAWMAAHALILALVNLLLAMLDDETADTPLLTWEEEATIALLVLAPRIPHPRSLRRLMRRVPERPVRRDPIRLWWHVRPRMPALQPSPRPTSAARDPPGLHPA